MDAARFARLCALFEEARTAGARERAGRVADVRRSDAELGAELERMLAADAGAPSFLEPPAELSGPAERSAGGPPARSRPGAAEPLSRVPRAIGPYRPLHVLGAGGMGIVYEALQESPERRVALKVLRGGFDSPSVVRRFRYEVDVLARLRHPGIAQVHEAGVHTGADGAQVPYFAMEYVPDAVDVVAFSERERLPLERRIELFLAVCDAVQHGHQLGVVHRDLKPANVLVGADGRPRVIDFGVARAVGGADARTLVTRSGEIVGTLTRMAPEQLEGDSTLVDTRADVYALGLLLYELLCRRLPYSVEDKPWTEIARTIRETPPVAPSRVDRTVPRDLDWTLLRALEKERERRYPSVSEFAADLRRFLADEPVLAGPPSGVYRARKFLRRHRVAVGAATVVVLALVAGAAAAAVGMVRARDAEAAAREDAARARTLWELTTDVLWSFQLGSQGADVRMVDVLRAASWDAEVLAGRPGIEADLHGLVGEGFRTLGHDAEAREHLERALRLSREARGPQDASTLALGRRLATVRQRLGEEDAARRLLAETEERTRRALGPDGEPMLRLRAARVLEFVPPGTPGRLAELRRLAARATEVLGPLDPVPLQLELGVAFELQESSRWAEALAQVDAVLAALAPSVPSEDPRVLLVRRDRALLLRLAGDPRAAAAALEALVPAWRRRFGVESRLTGLLMVELAKSQRLLGRHDEALAIVEREADLRRALDDPGGEILALLLFERGELLRKQGRLAEAEAALLEAVEASEAGFGTADVRTLTARQALAMVWIVQGRDADAITLLEDVVADAERAFGAGSRYLVELLFALGNALVPVDSDAALARLEQGARIARETLPEGHSARTDVLLALGFWLHDLGRPAEAEPVLLEVAEHAPDGSGQRAMARRTLANLYAARGNAEAAARYRDDAD